MTDKRSRDTLRHSVRIGKRKESSTLENGKTFKVTVFLRFVSVPSKNGSFAFQIY